MKKLLPFACMLTLWACFFISCSTDSPCMDGEGPIVTENRSISDFTGIANESEAIVYITEGAEFSISIDAEENLLPEIKTVKSGNDLRIYTDHCLEENDLIHIYITMPQLESLDLSGSGNIIIESIFHTSGFNMDLSGSGNISCYDSLFTDAIQIVNSGSGIINVFSITPDITVELSGSGDVVINGEGDIADYTSSGSGNIRAFNFPNTISHIAISGSGNVEVNTSDLIDGSISGSGSIFFKQSPVIDVDVSGSGYLIYVP